jgi:hypothetical protein
LPLSFFSDLDDLPPHHPEYKAVSECQSVEACRIGIVGVSRDGDFADEYIPLAGREREEWDFVVEITPNPRQCYEVLREQDEE